jgi:hypothetical protein
MRTVLLGYPRFELLDKSGKVRPRGRAINSQQLPGDESKKPPQLLRIEPGKEAVSGLLQLRRGGMWKSRVRSLVWCGFPLPVPPEASCYQRRSHHVAALRSQPCAPACLNSVLFIDFSLTLSQSSDAPDRISAGMAAAHSGRAKPGRLSLLLKPDQLGSVLA